MVCCNKNGLMFICDQLPLAEPMKPGDGFAANTTAKYNWMAQHRND